MNAITYVSQLLELTKVEDAAKSKVSSLEFELTRWEHPEQYDYFGDNASYLPPVQKKVVRTYPPVVSTLKFNVLKALAPLMITGLFSFILFCAGVASLMSEGYGGPFAFSILLIIFGMPAAACYFLYCRFSQSG